MGVFGPKYPAVLQVQVNHAEGFCEVLSALERMQAQRPERARAWLCGRRDEVEAFVACVAADWRHQRIGEQVAASELGTYLASLHDGTRAWLGSEPPLSCCTSVVAPTVLLAGPGPAPPSVGSEDASEEPIALEGEASHERPADG